MGSGLIYGDDGEDLTMSYASLIDDEWEFHMALAEQEEREQEDERRRREEIAASNEWEDWHE